MNLKVGTIRCYDLEMMLNSSAHIVLVAELARQACGYARIDQSAKHYQHKKNAYLGFIHVLPVCRKQGIGGKLLDALMDWGRVQGAGEARLDVFAGNDSAIRLYEKAGFNSLLLNMRKSL
ncbi:MAG: GNAT family N-acetyltransferase [Gammaproteobacteria bacterium]|nr:GNAT family N-acetyltransferase [Gammaproteobacteria bacterium]MCY4356171.1 GNAT family N-acetyltransferase [Gammaproteobacteria bacterium]